MKTESPMGRACRSVTFFTEFQKIIDHLLNSSSVIIAHSPDEENAIMAYLIYSPFQAVHYLWVRPSLRRLGIARCLVDEAFPGVKELQFTLNTNDAKRISQKYPELVYNPFILFNKGA